MVDSARRQFVGWTVEFVSMVLSDSDGVIGPAMQHSASSSFTLAATSQGRSVDGAGGEGAEQQLTTERQVDSLKIDTFALLTPKENKIFKGRAIYESGIGC